MANERKKKVVVTGNQGFIGSVLTEQLVRLGYKVVGIDAGIFEDVQMVPRVPAMVQVRKDIRDIEVNDLVGCDAIIHLAGLSNDPLGEMDVNLTYEINWQAGARLAEMAKKAKVGRFLFSSSCSTYGTSGQKLVDETNPLDPKTAYAKSKVMLEETLGQMNGGTFTPVILRNATVFGFSPRLRLDLVVNNLTSTGWLTGNIEVLSDGTPWRPNLHVDDCAQAFIFLMEASAEQVGGEAFNIGREDNNLQVREIAQQVKEEIKDSKVVIRSESTPDERTYRVSFAKIEELGWKAERSVKQGVRDLIDVFAKCGFDEKEAQFNGYYTLKRYQAMMEAGLISSDLRFKEGVKETV